MGVRVSPTPRITPPSTISSARNTSGALTMPKYQAASRQISVSAPIHRGITGDKPTKISVISAPTATETVTAWAAVRLACSASPAPLSRAMQAKKPVAKAHRGLFTSQVTVPVTPTAAMAAVPTLPTMA